MPNDIEPHVAADANNASTIETPALTSDDLPSDPALILAPDDAPKPPSWEDLGLHPDVKLALDDMGYFAPTAVQATVYKPVSENKDLLVQSKTGTGKTTAFGLPIVSRIIPAHRQPQAMILAPTRELALQVARELTKLGVHRGIVVEAIYGGAPIGKQITALKDGVHIIVGTPGRVLDHIGRRTLDPRTINTFVLDECDEMLSMGFLEDIERVVSHLPEKRQTLLFSATMPDEVTRYSRRHMKTPEQISLSRDGVSIDAIHHAYYIVSGLARGRDLLKILFAEEPSSAIIFCNTRGETTSVAKFLQKQGLDAEPLSSDLSQADRERVMGRMKAHNLRFLCATDVAARGIDISDLSHVINYSVPESPEVYVHRTGRTGRAGKKGTALSLVGPRELGNFRFVRLQFGIKPEERVLPKDDIFEGKLKVPLPPVGAATAPDPVQVLIRGVQLATSGVSDLQRQIFEKLLASAKGKQVLAQLVADRLDQITTKAKPRRERERPRFDEGGEHGERVERPEGVAAGGEREERGDRGERPRRFGEDRGGERPRRFGEDRGGERGERGERSDGGERGGERPRRFGEDRGGERGERSEGGERGGGERPPRRFDEGGGGERGERPRRFGEDRGERGGDRGERGGRFGDRDRGDRGGRFGDRDRGDRGGRFGDRHERRDQPANQDTVVVAQDAAPPVEAPHDAVTTTVTEAPTAPVHTPHVPHVARENGEHREHRGQREREHTPAHVEPAAPVAVAHVEPARAEHAERTERTERPDRGGKGKKGKSAPVGDTREFWETWAEEKSTRVEAAPAPAPAATEASTDAAEPAAESHERKGRGARGRGRGDRDRDTKLDMPAAARGKSARDSKDAKESEKPARAHAAEDKPAPARTKRDDAEAPPTNGRAKGPAPAAVEGAQARLFVNLGKKHGVSADDLRTLLAAPVGGDPAKIGSVSLRDSHAHVRVAEDLVDSIIGAVHGTTHGEHSVTVERAHA